MLKNYVCFFFLLLGFVSYAQEIQIFKVEDFDLKGRVKSCLVINDYGRELFEFNEEGLLTKTITQYSGMDQDITYYKYDNDELVEKRMESYKNNILDAGTSMAHFYTIDTIPNRKVTEKIISYDTEFVELQEYEFDGQNRLAKITTSNSGGIDEVVLEYVTYKNENTINYLSNTVMEKSIRTSKKVTPKGTQEFILTKEYIDGEPDVAFEEVFDSNGKLIFKETFRNNPSKKRFESEKKEFYSYSTEGILESIRIKTPSSEDTKEYIFQFDSNEQRNWIKQITLPDNKYITRKITYFPSKKVSEKSD